MSVTVNINGTNYTIPQTSETGWGNNVTSWIQAISSSTLQKNGGSFALTAEVDFGGAYGLRALYLKTDSITLAEVATQSTPASGFGKIYFKADGFLYQLNDDGSESKVGAGTGGINYITNPDAESNTSGYATYADAAGVAPVDGTGGTAGITFTRSTSSPLRGAAEFLTTKGASNLQGNGASYDFTIASADQGKILRIGFDYRTSASYADGDIRVYIYDVTNSVLIEPTVRDLAANTFNASYLSEFQTNSNSTSYRLIWHVSSTNASAYTVKMDNVSCGPREIARGAVITNFTSYTPTGTWSTNTTYSGFWRRVGDSMQLLIKVALTGAPTGNFTLNLPSGYSIDTAKIPDTSLQNFGTSYATTGSGGANQRGEVIYNSATSVRIVSTAIWNATVPGTFGNTDFVDLIFYVPIVGWSSTMNISSDFGGRVIAMRARRSTSDQVVSSTSETTIVFNDISSPTIYGDTVAAYNISTGSYTVVESGWYKAVAGVVLSGCTSGEGMFLYIKADSTRVAQTKDDVASANRAFSASSGVFYLSTGQVVTAAIQSTVDTSYNVVNDASTYLAIEKVQTPQTLANGEVVAVHYASDAAQSISSGNIINFEDLVYDTHSLVTIGASWKAIIQTSGFYDISCQILFGSASFTAGNQIILQLHKSGSFIKQFDFIEVQASVTMPINLNGTTTLKLVRGDYLDVRVVHDVGAARSLDVSGALNYITINKRN